MENYVEIKMKAELKNVAIARVAISSFIAELDVTIDDLMDIKTSVSEAVTNAIEHGYEEKSTKNNEDNFVIVRGYIKSEDEDYIKIEIEDFGIGIMETFMDEVFIDSKKDEGTVITLTKVIRKRKSKLI